MKKKYIIIGIIFLILAGVFAFLIWQDYNKVTTVRVMDKDNLIYPFWVAEDKGFLNENKIKVEKVDISKEKNMGESWDTDNSAYVKWLGENTTDIAIVSTDNLFDLESKYPGKYKAFAFVSDTSSDYMDNIVVYKDSTILSPEKLSGKKIATGIYDIDNLMLSEYLRSAGIEAQAEKIPNSQPSQYLASGKADAVYIQEPRAAQLVTVNKNVNLVKNPSDKIDGALRNAQTRVFVMSSDFAKNKRAAGRLVKAFEKAITVSAEDNRSALSNHLDSSWDSTIKARTFARIELYNATDINKLQKIGDTLFEQKYIEAKPNVSNILYK